MDVYEALYTTRAMRRVRTDPIPEDVQRRILDAAIRAPSGGNSQNWRFLLVDDNEVIGRLAPIYRKALSDLWATFYKPRIDAALADPDAPASVAMLAVQRSADWMADHFADYPLLMFGFAQHDGSGGSIYPAIWSAQLAARAEGVGATLTSVLAFYTADVLDVLAVPTDDGWTMAGCVAFGYPTGRWGVADRRPAHEVAYRNRWGNDVGFRIDQPLWPPA